MNVREVQALANLAVRYILAGGSFVLGLGFLKEDRFGFLRLRGDQDISLYFTSLLIGVAGITIYALHRALAYRAILPALMILLIWRRDLHETWRALDRRLTARRHERRVRDEPIQHHFDTWAAEAHFLYASAWGSLSAAVVCYLTQPILRFTWVAMVLIAGLVLLVAALVHDFALMGRDLDEP